MSRIAACFAALQADGRRALIPFVTAAHPAATVTVPLMHAMAARGADIIELGIPFSDPMADGPVIQRASERALAAGASLRGVLDIVASFRSGDATTPVVLMGYLNPIETMGYETFAAAAADAGVDGVLTVDLPPEEADELTRPLRARDIDPIFLLAPNSDTERVARVSAQASGYVYYVSLKGVTGSAALDVDSVAARVSAIKAASGLPVGVGFGIRDAETAARVAAVSDAVVVGSVLVQAAEDSLDQPDMIPERVSAIIASMRAAMDAAA